MTTFDVSDLRALFINCTLKPTPEVSNTQRLMDNAIAIMRSNGVAIDEVRAVDHEIPPGVQPDMTEHGFAQADGLARLGRGRATRIRAAAGRRTTSPVATRRSWRGTSCTWRGC
jgi:hypothetical protein